MKLFFKFLLIICISYSTNAQVGIGNTNPQGALDITSTDNGLLIPRVALTATNTNTPVITVTDSELVYNIATTTTGTNDVTPGFYYWSAAATSWVRFGGSTGWQITGNDDIVDGTNFIGTIINVDVAFRRNGAAAGKIGASSTSFGVGALSNGAASNSTAIGNNALASNTGSFNVAIGKDAMWLNTSNGQWNVAIGNDALKTSTSGSTQNNVAIGYNALGTQAGEINQSVAIGSGASRNSNGNNNTAVGYWALAGNNGTNTGIDNVAIGKLALQFDTSGQQNVAVGSESLKFLTSGSFNAAVGHLSGSAVTSGANNSFLGLNAGNNVTTGSNNIAIGSGAQVPTATASNQIVIGAGVAGTAYVNAPSWLTSSDRRLKMNIIDSQLGLEFLKGLRPVSYSRIDNVAKETEFGFIAQELDAALISAGITNNGIISKTANDMFAVRYNDFLPITVKAVQEQQELIEELQQQNAELLKANAAILKRLEALENK